MLFITIIEFLISRSSRKKIQIKESHDLSNHPLSSSPSRPSSLFFFLFFPLLFEILAHKVMTSQHRKVARLECRDIGLLSCLTSTSGRWVWALQSTSSSLHTASKCRRFRLKCTRSRVSNVWRKTHLLMYEMT